MLSFDLEIPSVQSGLFGLGADLSENDKKFWITRVLDGSLARELGEKRRNAQTAAGDAYTAWNKAEKLPAGPNKSGAIASAKRAHEAAVAYLKSIQATIESYNKAASSIQVAAGSAGINYAPKQLGDLGAFPVAIVAICLGSVIVMGFINNMVSNYFASKTREQDLDQANSEAKIKFINGGGNPDEAIKLFGGPGPGSRQSPTPPSATFNDVASSVIWAGGIGFLIYVTYLIWGRKGSGGGSPTL